MWPSAQMEQIHRDQRRLGVVGEDVGVAAFGRGHLLLLAHLFHGVQQFMQRRGFFVAHGRAGVFHALAQFLRQILVPAFQEQPDGAHRFGVLLVGGQPLDARTQAAMDVIFEARMRVVARQIDIAGRHLEMPVNEVHQPVRQIAGKIRPEVGRAILAQPPGHIHARIPLGGELDVRISFVVAQQNVVARLPLLDQVVFERQRFLLVIDLDEIDARALRRSACRF